jgi:hypothetical protein
MSRRPVSHYIAGFYFFAVAAAFTFAGYTAVQARESGYVGAFLYAAPYAVALAALVATRAKWSYFLCAFLIFAFPAFLVASMLLILFKVERATLASVGPSLFGAGLLLWLFCAFTLGGPSKAFYGIGRPRHDSRR